MAEKSKKTRVGFYIDSELLAKCDNCLRAANAQSRNEFVNDAIRMYVGHWEATDTQQYLSRYITSAMRGMLDDTENRMATLLFKLTVELGITMNVLAAMADIDDETLRKLRIKCVEDAKRTNGTVTFAGVVKSQRERS